MAELVFKDLSFEKDKGKVKVNFLRLFYFYLEEENLARISQYEISKNSIIFKLFSCAAFRNIFEYN